MREKQGKAGAVQLFAQLKRLAVRCNDFFPDQEYNDSCTYIN